MEEKYIFRYNNLGVTKNLVLFNDLQILVGDSGWVRKRDFPVRVVGVIEPDKLKVVEISDDSQLVKNGHELTIKYSEFYQGGKLDT